MRKLFSRFAFVFLTAGTCGAATAAAPVIDSETNIPIGAAVAVIGVVAPATWWLSRKFTATDLALSEIRSELEAIKKRLP